MLRQLSRRNRYLILLVGLLLLGLYFAPLWFVQLTAPQYPEGLGMNLWIHKITGLGQFDLQNINLLNHYVGMDPIIEQAIPEFGYMPYVVAFMILGAVVTFLYPRRFMVYLGLANLLLVGTAGMWDFWRWEYNYGHHLNPGAPISIPGMVYQPPLLGCKQLLNIESCSWPHLGGYLLFLVTAVLLFVIVSEHSKGTASK
ncbi:MAG: hypothetical protein COV45_01225 [Deltaproteobacteria bacterium CG11_big_fil_rev_8_21_14_0_20_47_16]|nr:MAG: hypothetical protein COV45_01225 [Deltaproteobacteria bacterium CG11_big_fil_rev_8_21_14_0_20_47_16]